MNSTEPPTWQLSELDDDLWESLLLDLEYMEAQHQAMVDWVVRLANQNSGTLNLSGVAAVKSMLLDEFRQLGDECRLVDSRDWVTTDSQGNAVSQPLGQSIHVLKRPSASFKVMLCIHMDTVYGAEDSFQRCRWLDEVTLNGPGVADAKGGIVVMLYALRTLERSKLAGRLGWEVILNADEEVGSPGSIPLIRERAPHCQLGLLFEPTLPDGSLISWRKGSGNFTFVVRGRSVHAGRDFQAGRNAITALARLLTRIDELNVNEEITLNVGRVEGGGALNIVPDLAIGRVNVRITTAKQQRWVEEQLDQVVRKANEQEGISVVMEGEFSSPPKPLDAGTRVLQKRIEQCADRLGIEIRWRGTGGASDGNKFLSAGLPNIDTLGPCGGDIHSTNEYLKVDSLVPRTKLAALILLSLAASTNIEVT